MGKKLPQNTNDLHYEGKNKVFLDVDRMINEGLSGGSVYSRCDAVNIEEAHDFPVEQPPYDSK